MKSIVTSVVVGAAMAAAKELSDFGLNEAQTQHLFTSFMTQHERQYEVSEVQQRYGNFKEALRFIMEHNASEDAKDFTLAINQFADRTQEEIDGMLGTSAAHDDVLSSFANGPTEVHDQMEFGAVNIDWRNKGVLQAVRNQGQCGSCYAFSAVAAMEAGYARTTGKAYRLSEQELVDCSSSYGNYGCSGGAMQNCFQYASAKGSRSGSQYGYTGTVGTCSASTYTPVVKPKSYVRVAQNAASLLSAISVTPVSVALKSNCSYFLYYSSGILTKSCGTQIDHGVTLVGAGTENNVDYYIVRNSWGSSWGRAGHVYIARNANICGIETSSLNAYPTF